MDLHARDLGDRLDVVDRVRAGDLRLERRDVDRDDPLVDGVGVGDDRLDRVGDARLLAQVADRLRVGRTMPDVAPASTDMLQTARRPEVDIFRIVSPWNSRTRKLAPCAVSVPTTWRIRSFGPTCGPNSPFTSILIVVGTSMLRATPSVQTEAISVAPMPNEKAPRAPWLVVWESVPTTTCPGLT